MSASPQAQPAPAHLGPIVAEDAHHTDRNSFVQTAAQSLAVESEHKGNVLFTSVSDDGVQGVVQSTCPREGTGMTGEASHGLVGTLVARAFATHSNTASSLRLASHREEITLQRPLLRGMDGSMLSQQLRDT